MLFDIDADFAKLSDIELLADIDVDKLIFLSSSIFVICEIEALMLDAFATLVLIDSEIDLLVLALIPKSFARPWLSTTETDVDNDALFDADIELMTLVDNDSDSDLLIDANSDNHCFSKIESEADSLTLTAFDLLILAAMEIDSDLLIEANSDNHCLFKIESDVDSLMLTDLETLKLCDVDLDSEIDADCDALID